MAEQSMERFKGISKLFDPQRGHHYCVYDKDRTEHDINTQNT